MSEWWTYTLSDFLLFSPRTYYRLFEIYNAAIWPLPLAALALGGGLGFAVRRPPSRARTAAIAAVLAGGWAFVAVAFLWRRYATINWAARYFAGAFLLEAVLLAGFALPRNGLRFGAARGSAAAAGLALFLFALLVLPAAAPVLGRGWRQAEVFGVAPDPTAIATLGLLVLSRGRGRGILMTIPVLWCGITGATLFAMKSAAFWAAPAAGALAVGFSIAGRVRPRDVGP